MNDGTVSNVNYSTTLGALDGERVRRRSQRAECLRIFDRYFQIERYSRRTDEIARLGDVLTLACQRIPRSS